MILEIYFKLKVLIVEVFLIGVLGGYISILPKFIYLFIKKMEINKTICPTNPNSRCLLFWVK